MYREDAVGLKNFLVYYWAYQVLEKGLSFINENQNLYCEYMFCVWNFKNIDWEHFEFDDTVVWNDYLLIFSQKCHI